MFWATSLGGREYGEACLNKVRRLVKVSIVPALEQMDPNEMQPRLMLNYCISIALLVVKVMSSNVALNAIIQVTGEVQDDFNASMPEDMMRNYYELKQLFASASKKLTDIQSKCDSLVDEVSDNLFNITTAHLLNKLIENRNFRGASTSHVSWPFCPEQNYL